MCWPRAARERESVENTRTLNGIFECAKMFNLGYVSAKPLANLSAYLFALESGSDGQERVACDVRAAGENRASRR